jgi:hypothetical protein
VTHLSGGPPASTPLEGTSTMPGSNRTRRRCSYRIRCALEDSALRVRLTGAELGQATAHDVRGRNPRGVPRAIGRVEVCIADVHGDQDRGDRSRNSVVLKTHLGFRERSAPRVAIVGSARYAGDEVQVLGRH